MDTDQRIDLIAALNRLSPRQRKVVLLWAAGYTQQEIAKEYNVHRTTIGRWISNSLHLLGDSKAFNNEGTM